MKNTSVKILSIILCAACIWGLVGGIIGINEIKSAKAYWEQTGEEAEESFKLLDGGIEQLTENTDAYLDGVIAYEEGQDDYEAGLLSYEEGLDAYEKGQKDLEEGAARLAAGQAAYDSNSALLAQAHQAYDEGVAS